MMRDDCDEHFQLYKWFFNGQTSKKNKIDEVPITTIRDRLPPKFYSHFLSQFGPWSKNLKPVIFPILNMSHPPKVETLAISWVDPYETQKNTWEITNLRYITVKLNSYNSLKLRSRTCAKKTRKWLIFQPKRNFQGRTNDSMIRC